jgi:hypothetical protein
VNTISTRKAIAFDGISDLMFHGNQAAKTKTALIIKDAWTSKWEEHIENEHHFDSRLMVLNKVHPKIPLANQYRPINISSPWYKTLETRLYPKLRKYLSDKLHRGQTGFVPGMGIMVNQMRLIDRVCEKTFNGRKQYGLFIDFSNAYNTILHTKLYERLEGILTSDEIQLLKALYSRQRVLLGKESFTPNVGVAQGSIISPALFNIYSADLYEQLEVKAYINFKDLMGYADDLLILCDSKYQLSLAIKTIQEWSKENNLGLNAKKSGILEFFNRSGHSEATLNIGQEYDGIPVVAFYKYLGMWVDGKLTMDRQIDEINKKANWIQIKLWQLAPSEKYLCKLSEEFMEYPDSPPL